jgi:hypothetical protein
MTSEVCIDGKHYRLCCDWSSLVAAESYYAERIHGFNLAEALCGWGTDHESIRSGARKLLPAALRRWHPDVTYDDAQAMLDRAWAADDPTLIQALWTLLHLKKPESDAANRNLRFELNAMADANYHFGGEPGLAMLWVEDQTLAAVWRAFPCAVHKFRPELGLEEARALMTIESVLIVVALLRHVDKATPQDMKDAVQKRLMAAMSEEQKREFAFRAMLRNIGNGPAQA